MAADVRVVIGQILGAHGVRGELKLRPLTDYPDRFFDMAELSLYRDGRQIGTYPLLNVRDQMSRGFLLVTLHGIDTMDAADQLRGCSVEVADDDRVPLRPGEFWISDLIGLDACDEAGSKLGTVKDIVSSGTSQLLVIADENGKEHLVPAAPEFFLNADIAARRITLRLIEGLWKL